MNRTKFYKVKSFFKLIYIKIRKIFSVNDEKRISYPKRYTNDEKTAADIFMIVLKSPDSKLYYDIISNECYIRSADSSMYVFLESRKLKIINSVYGYDIKISNDMETYLGHKFRLEMSKRRRIFKEEALQRVKYSLNQTLEKLKKK